MSGSFQVKVEGDRVAQRISFGPVPGTTVGVPVVLTASSWSRQFARADWPTGLAVSYSSQNLRVCTVSGAAVVPRTGGRCVITATQDGSARYLPAEPVTQAFPVARASQEEPPQTVLDLLSASGEDGPRAVLLSPDAAADLDRALHNIPATLREAAVRETMNAARSVLDVDLIGVSVVFNISALVAGIRGGRLVAVHSGRCGVTATLSIQDTKVISRQGAFELPGIIPLGRESTCWPTMASRPAQARRHRRRRWRDHGGAAAIGGTMAALGMAALGPRGQARAMDGKSS